MRRGWSKLSSFVIVMLASIGLIGMVVVLASTIQAGNGWFLVDSSYYKKAWVYDSTTLDAPDSFYLLTGWHTNNTAADATARGESRYGLGTAGSTDGSVGGSVYSTGATNLTSVDGATVNLYVSWEKNKYTITYNPNNVTYNRYGNAYTTTATGTTGNTSCLYDTDVTLAVNGFSRVGYQFKEWNTMSDGSGTSYSSGQYLTKPNFTSVDGYRNPAAATVTLYAIWEPITYKVYLYENDPYDATHDIVNQSPSGWDFLLDSVCYTKTMRYDSPDLLPTASETYKIVGWKTDDTKWYTSGGYNGATSGTEYASHINNLTSTQGAVINLYPKWIKHRYTIKYSGNNTATNIYGDPMTTTFTGSTADTACQYDTNVTLAVNGFSRPGYDFKEWNTKSDGTGTSYSSGQYLTKPNFTDVDYGEVTLYAIWTPKTYRVYLKPSGGTVDSWDDTYGRYYYDIRFDQCVVRNLPSCTINNHRFIGWARKEQSIGESTGTGSYINEFYYQGDRRIYLSNNRSKLANDIWFNPLGTEELAVYAWYNTIPTFADVYDGMFYEGQRVSYADLIDLVSVFDYEDDYYNAAVQYIYDLPEVNESDIYIPIHKQDGTDTNESNGNVETSGPQYKLDTTRWIDNGDGTYTEIATGRKYYTIEKKMELESQINASSLVIKISDISYGVSNGVALDDGSWESKMGAVDDAEWSNEGILESKYWLDTSTGRVDKTSLTTEGRDTAYDNALGKFNITFTVTDEGIMCGGSLVVDSPITMNYTRLCTIHYNASPMIYIRNVMWYEDTTDLEDISSILSNQLVLDSEDCVNNPPWWYAKGSDNTTGAEPKTYHGNVNRALRVIYKTGSTSEDLQLTLKEDFVWGVVVSPYLLREYDDIALSQAVSDWVDSGIKVADISALKGNSGAFLGECTKAELYDAILSFNVCLDARDQWGKWASGKVDAQNHKNPDSPDAPDPSTDPDGEPDGPEDKPDTPPYDPNDPDSGQPVEKRSVTVYKVNTDTDIDMTQANVREKVRFIDDKYVTEIVGENNYWGDSTYGYDILQGILNQKGESVNKTPLEYEGSYNGKNGNKVDVKVNDYTVDPNAGGSIGR